MTSPMLTCGFSLGTGSSNRKGILVANSRSGKGELAVGRLPKGYRTEGQGADTPRDLTPASEIRSSFGLQAKSMASGAKARRAKKDLRRALRSSG